VQPPTRYSLPSIYSNVGNLRLSGLVVEDDINYVTVIDYKSTVSNISVSYPDSPP